MDPVDRLARVVAVLVLWPVMAVEDLLARRWPDSPVEALRGAWRSGSR